MGIGDVLIQVRGPYTGFGLCPNVAGITVPNSGFQSSQPPW